MVRIGKRLSVTVDGRTKEVCFERMENGTFQMLFEGAVHRFWPSNHAVEDREFALVLDGQAIRGLIDDRRSVLMQRTRGGPSGKSGHVTVKAPMPGLVVRILVTPGMLVEKGQGLLLLEAMKMENEMKSDRTGRIDAVLVKEHMPVEKGQALIDIKVD